MQAEESNAVKGKPAARWGRKATGPTRSAGLPAQGRPCCGVASMQAR